jgi:hypothetical protein
VARIQTISEFEPVWLLAPPSAVKEVRPRFKGCNVEVIETQVNDIWMRDIAPNFAVGADGLLQSIGISEVGARRLKRICGDCHLVYGSSWRAIGSGAPG